MSFLRRLFGKGDPPPGPDALRQALLDAAADRATLESLCRRHRQLIAQHFPTWRQVPDEVRDRPDQLDRYVQGLIAVAECFAQALGDQSLMQVLIGPPGDNPVERWRQALERARRDMAELRYREGAEQLTDLAIDVGRLRGTAVDSFLPVVLGSLGECWFQSGQAERAVEPTRQALERVRAADDTEGVAAYLGNLYEIFRYLDRRAEAADCADELAALAEQQGRPGDARRYRQQARLVRAGEPPVRVVVDLGGQRYEPDEVPGGLSGSVRFLFERNRLTLRPAQVLTEQGEREAEQGHYEAALQLFLEASRADPLAPQPVYEAALTYLYLGRPGDAADAYERTDELAPGWFHCRADGWLARQIVAGRYDLDTFRLLHVLEDGNQPIPVKWQMAERALERMPDLAPLHLRRGKLLLARNQSAGAEAAFRRGLECALEPDVRTRLLVELAAVVESPEEKRRLCEQARQLNGHLVAAATATVMLAQE
jgi:tetratricopeptide (TPR) repeat protein